MKRHYVNELAEGMVVDSVFALRSKEMRVSRSGDAYLSLEVADRSGQLPAVYFSPSGEAIAVPVGAIVQVRGRVTSFKKRKRISITSLCPADVYDPTDLIVSGPSSTTSLQKQFLHYRTTIADVGLMALLDSVFEDRPFAERFARCPGSQSHHHAYLGGLLEHTVSVARLCGFLADQYPQADRDVLIAAALIHDIGTCDELTFETSIEYTDCGRLLGHVVLGLHRLQRAAANVAAALPAQRLLMLQHAVMSHHYEDAPGPTKPPGSLEALLLSHADSMDATANAFSAVLSGPARVGETWTASDNFFRRELYSPQALQDEASCGVAVDVDRRSMRAVG